MNPILLHRTYANSLEQTFCLAWKLGFNGVEVNAPGLTETFDAIPAQIEQLARLKESWLTQNMVLHFPMGLIEDEKWSERQSVYEKMARSFELASRELGVKLFNTMASGTIIPKGNKYTDYGKNGSIAANETHWERAVAMLKQAAELAAEHGITLAIETHGCLIHDTPEATLKLVQLVGADNLTINLDLPNMVLTRGDFLQENEVAPLIPHIGHVHMKNLRMVLCGNGGWLLEGVGNGMINYTSLVQSLHKAGYKGAYALEFPSGYGDFKEAAKRDIVFTKNLLLHEFSC